MNDYIGFIRNKSFLGSFQSQAQLQYLINYLNTGGTFTFSTNGSGNATLVNNQGSLSDGLAYSGNPVVIGAGNELTFSTPNSNEYVYQNDINTGLIETLATGTTVTGSQGTFDWMCILNSTKQLSTADKARTDLGYQIVQCALGKTHLLSIVQSDIKYWYVPNTLDAGTIKDGNGLANIVIPSYSKATQYDNTDFNQKGLQTLPLVIDATGRVTDIDFTKLHFRGLGDYVDTGMIFDSTKPFTLTVFLNTGASALRATNVDFGSYEAGKALMIRLKTSPGMEVWAFNVIRAIASADNTDAVIFCSFDGISTVDYYYNGTKQTSSTVTPAQTIKKFFIGITNGLASGKFDSVVHDFKFENGKYITQSEVTQITNQYLGI